MNLINGTQLAKDLRNNIKADVASLAADGITPHLGVILVGDNAASKTYVGVKKRAAEKAGMMFTLVHLPEASTTAEVMVAVQELQSDESLHGLIVQLPLPDHIDANDVLAMLDPEKDVDCLTETNLGKLIFETHTFVPPTPGAVMAAIAAAGVTELAGKNITLVGTGQLVGRPLSAVLINTKASVTTVNETTKDIREKCLAADIIVSGVGKAGVVTGDMISDKTIVIDTGVDYVDGKITGDVDIASLEGRDVQVTPTPGGIGPVTVAKLLENTLLAAKAYAQ